jgi:hypothetical protein
VEFEIWDNAKLAVGVSPKDYDGDLGKEYWCGPIVFETSRKKVVPV